MTDIDYKQPISTKIHGDGRVEKSYADGRREETFPNGTVLLHVLVDGCIPYTTVIMPLKTASGEQE